MSDGTQGHVFRRMVDALNWTARSLAEEVEELDEGWCIRTPSLPQVWSLNHLFLRSPPKPDGALALADRFQAGSIFRHIEIGGATTVIDEDAFVRDGWKVDREVYMILSQVPAAPELSQISQLTTEEVTRLMGEWIEEDHPGISPSSRAQIEEASRREGRLWHERAFGILDERGVPSAVTKLRVGRNLAWVEDVFTSAPARGRGYARRLVCHAATLAARSNVDFTFIVADDNDWPKNLYAALGFLPVGKTWTLHREVAL